MIAPQSQAFHCETQLVTMSTPSWSGEDPRMLAARLQAATALSSQSPAAEQHSIQGKIYQMVLQISEKVGSAPLNELRQFQPDFEKALKELTFGAASANLTQPLQVIHCS